MRSEKEVNHDAKPVKYLRLEGAEIHTGPEADVMEEPLMAAAL